MPLSASRLYDANPTSLHGRDGLACQRPDGECNIQRYPAVTLCCLIFLSPAMRDRPRPRVSPFFIPTRLSFFLSLSLSFLLFSSRHAPVSFVARPRLFSSHPGFSESTSSHYRAHFASLSRWRRRTPPRRGGCLLFTRLPRVRTPSQLLQIAAAARKSVPLLPSPPHPLSLAVARKFRIRRIWPRARDRIFIRDKCTTEKRRISGSET